MSILKDLLQLQDDEAFKSQVVESEHDDDDDEGGEHDSRLEKMDFSELLEKFREKQGYSMEGRRGLTTFARLCAIIGYKDRNYYGQLDSDASIGDITNFLEDNSGAFDAMIEFMERHSNDEWEEGLREWLAEHLDEAKVEKRFKIIKTKGSKTYESTGTLAELIKYHGYTLETGKSYESEKGNKKINVNPKTIAQLVDNLNKAVNNAAANGYANVDYAYEELGELKEEVEELEEAVFDESRYTWYVWTLNKPSPVIERRGGSLQLERGMQFGLRKATSKKDGTMRLVVKSRGPSIVFSVPQELGEKIEKAAVKLR